MSAQRYVYTTYEIGRKDGKIGDIESVISEYARQGWRLSETLSRNGTTIKLVFEREVQDDS